MKTLLLLIAALVLIGLCLEIVRIGYRYSISRSLANSTQPYERTEGTHSLLVLGDSTAVALGTTDHSKSVGGRLGAYLDASVENHSVSGATTSDLPSQMSALRREHYDVILIQIGANDVIKMRSLAQAGDNLSRALDTLSAKSDHVIVLTAGRIGDAPFFPWFVRSFLNMRAGALRERFIKVVDEHGALYIDLYGAPDLGFNTDPNRYYAPDGLHLSDDGYGLWFGELLKEAQVKWPEVFHE